MFKVTFLVFGFVSRCLNLAVFDSIKLIVIDSRLVVLKTRPNGNYGHNSFEKGKFSKSALFLAPVRLRAPRAPPATLIIVEPFCPWQNVCIIGTPTRAYTSDTRIQCARATRVFRQGRDVKQRTRTTTNGNFTRVTVNGEIYAQRLIIDQGPALNHFYFCRKQNKIDLFLCLK